MFLVEVVDVATVELVLVLLLVQRFQVRDLRILIYYLLLKLLYELLIGLLQLIKYIGRFLGHCFHELFVLKQLLVVVREQLPDLAVFRVTDSVKIFLANG